VVLGKAASIRCLQERASIAQKASPIICWYIVLDADKAGD